MMKKTFILTLAIVATCIVSHGTNGTIATQEFPQQSAKPLQAHRDSGEPMRQTKDMAFLDVKGPVKSINIDNNTFMFSEQGKLLKTSKISLRRSSSAQYEGCLEVMKDNVEVLTIFIDDNILEYQIDKKTKKIVGMGAGCGDWFIVEYYNYDANGNLVSITQDYEADFDEQTYEIIRKKRTLDVKIVETDKYGNWIKRKIGDNVEIRKIKYWS